MYAVIFKAKIKAFDDEYAPMAGRLRDDAFKQYGCVDFISTTEGDWEIAISYWNDLEQITRWKQNAEHLVAQKQGRGSGYQYYQVQVTEVLREYEFGTQ